MIYRIEETKGLTKAAGNFVVKRKGKVVQYFWQQTDAHDYVQSAIEAERAQ